MTGMFRERERADRPVRGKLFDEIVQTELHAHEFEL